MVIKPEANKKKVRTTIMLLLYILLNKTHLIKTTKLFQNQMLQTIILVPER